MNPQLSTTDYSNIAKMILVNMPDQSEVIEVEYTSVNCTVFVEVDYVVEYRAAIGGSYEGREFEQIAEVTRKTVEVTAVWDEAGCEYSEIATALQQMFN